MILYLQWLTAIWLFKWFMKLQTFHKDNKGTINSFGLIVFHHGSIDKTSVMFCLRHMMQLNS